jgi:hypothetical protein
MDVTALAPGNPVDGDDAAFEYRSRCRKLLFPGEICNTFASASRWPFSCGTHSCEYHAEEQGREGHLHVGVILFSKDSSPYGEGVPEHVLNELHNQAWVVSLHVVPDMRRREIQTLR